MHVRGHRGGGQGDPGRGRHAVSDEAWHVQSARHTHVIRPEAGRRHGVRSAVHAAVCCSKRAGPSRGTEGAAVLLGGRAGRVLPDVRQCQAHVVAVPAALARAGPVRRTPAAPTPFMHVHVVRNQAAQPGALPGLGWGKVGTHTCGGCSTLWPGQHPARHVRWRRPGCSTCAPSLQYQCARWKAAQRSGQRAANPHIRGECGAMQQEQAVAAAAAETDRPQVAPWRS